VRAKIVKQAGSRADARVGPQEPGQTVCVLSHLHQVVELAEIEVMNPHAAGVQFGQLQQVLDVALEALVVNVNHLQLLSKS
jgi:hypothetical protein